MLDATVQETNVWLKLTMDRLHTDDRHATYLALRAALHALRDRLGPEHATHLGVHLPLLLRGVCYEGWRMAATPTCERSPAEFVADVRHELPPDTGIDANLASRASLAVPWEKLDSGEVAKMQRILPQELQSLWPPPWRAAAGRAPERSGSPGRPQARSLSPVAPSFCAQWAQQ